ncbi:MAG: hypothetical protein V8T62_01980 [Oscillospiraceae bacterium]
MIGAVDFFVGTEKKKQKYSPPFSGKSGQPPRFFEKTRKNFKKEKKQKRRPKQTPASNISKRTKPQHDHIFYFNFYLLFSQMPIL